MSNIYQANEENIAKAAEVIKNGGLAAMPTETVYGLAANALNGEAVKKIFLAKGRPQDNPLIVHIADFDQIYDLCPAVPPQAKLLADAFWPGPLTMIVPKGDCIPDEVSCGLDTEQPSKRRRNGRHVPEKPPGNPAFLRLHPCRNKFRQG